MKSRFEKFYAISLSVLFVVAATAVPKAHAATNWRDFMPESTNFYNLSDRGGDWSFRKMGNIGDGNPSRYSSDRSGRSDRTSKYLEIIDSIGEDLFIMPKVLDW